MASVSSPSYFLMRATSHIMDLLLQCAIEVPSIVKIKHITPIFAKLTGTRILDFFCCCISHCLATPTIYHVISIHAYPTPTSPQACTHTLSHTCTVFFQFVLLWTIYAEGQVFFQDYNHRICKAFLLISLKVRINHKQVTAKKKKKSCTGRYSDIFQNKSYQTINCRLSLYETLFFFLMKLRNISGCGCFSEIGNLMVLVVSSVSEKFIRYDSINFAVYDSFCFHNSN